MFGLLIGELLCKGAEVTRLHTISLLKSSLKRERNTVRQVCLQSLPLLLATAAVPHWYVSRYLLDFSMYEKADVKE